MYVVWENIQCNTQKYDYLQRHGKKTLHKWVWRVKGPAIAALKLPVLLTPDNTKFRQFLLYSHHNFSIASQYSLLSQLAKFWQKLCPQFPNKQHGCGAPCRGQAGGEGPRQGACPSWRRGRTQRLRSRPATPAPSLCPPPWAAVGSLGTSRCSCPEENVCPLQPFPSRSSTQLCAGTSTCSI